MKTTYRRANVEAERKTMILVGVIVVGVLVLSVPFVRSGISRGVYATAPEFWEMGNNVRLSTLGFFEQLRAKRALVRENESLRAELATMEAQILDRNLLAEHVNQLEESLHRSPKDDRVVGRVLSNPSTSPYDTLSLDVGSDNGIQVGDAVVLAGSAALGSVTEVYPSSAKVTLLSSPGETLNVLLGKEKVPAQAVGRGMGNFEATIPQGTGVVVGDTVLFAREDLLLGVVGAIEEVPSEPTVRVLFRTSFNTATIRTVEVLTSDHE